MKTYEELPLPSRWQWYPGTRCHSETTPRISSGFIVPLHYIVGVLARLPCSHRWSQDSHHRRLLLAPSSTACRWRCSCGPRFGPAGRWLQSQLRASDKRNQKVRVGDGELKLENNKKKYLFLPSLTSAFSVSSTFWPLMSLWMTLWAWRWERPWQGTEDKRRMRGDLDAAGAATLDHSPSGFLCRCRRSSPLSASCPWCSSPGPSPIRHHRIP